MMSNMSTSSSELSRLITTDKWEQAISVVQSRPNQARQWTKRQGFFEGMKDSSVLPLHEAVVAPMAPFPFVEAILAAYPSAVHCKESSYGRLPLHCACRRNALPEVISKLIDGYRDACLVPDSLGRLPLHYALSNGADERVVGILLGSHPASARGCDARGWTPLHVATSMGASTKVVAALLEAYPEAAIMKTRKGSSPSKSLNKNCPHRDEVKKLLDKAKSDFDATFVHPILNKNSPCRVNIEDMVFV